MKLLSFPSINLFVRIMISTIIPSFFTIFLLLYPNQMLPISIWFPNKAKSSLQKKQKTTLSANGCFDKYVNMKKKLRDQWHLILIGINSPMWSCRKSVGDSMKLLFKFKHFSKHQFPLHKNTTTWDKRDRTLPIESPFVL